MALKGEKQCLESEIARLKAENERLKIALTLSQKHFSQQRDAAEKADEQCAELESQLKVARRETWEKCIRVLKDSPQGIWCAQEAMLRAEAEKDG